MTEFVFEQTSQNHNIKIIFKLYSKASEAYYWQILVRECLMDFSMLCSYTLTVTNCGFPVMSSQKLTGHNSHMQYVHWACIGHLIAGQIVICRPAAVSVRCAEDLPWHDVWCNEPVESWIHSMCVLLSGGGRGEFSERERERERQICSATMNNLL